MTDLITRLDARVKTLVGLVVAALLGAGATSLPMKSGGKEFNCQISITDEPTKVECPGVSHHDSFFCKDNAAGGVSVYRGGSTVNDTGSTQGIVYSADTGVPGNTSHSWLTVATADSPLTATCVVRAP